MRFLLFGSVFFLAVLSVSLSLVSCHGALTFPASTRHHGSLDSAGMCERNQCLWFSQFSTIPGPPTVNDPDVRTYNIHTKGCGPDDWSCNFPWRAPGSAPVRGSGCGVAGGGPVPLFDGGFAPVGYDQGADAVDVLAPQPAARWETGSVQEVAWAITANHGGGYSYRLCKADDRASITEECFQQTPLKFAGDTQFLQWSPLRVPHSPRYEIPLTKVTDGVTPAGSEWAKNPIPACDFCDPMIACGGVSLLPNYTDPSGTVPWGGKNLTYFGGKAWIDQVHCGVVCGGESLPTAFPNDNNGTQFFGRTDGQLCGSQVQFPEPIPGRTSGFVVNHTYPEISVDAFNIIDKIMVPMNLEPGKYLLSWRWDCEQSMQIWQSCADIEIVSTSDSNGPNGSGSADHHGMDHWKMGLLIAFAVAFVVSVIVNIYLYRQKRTRENREQMSLNAPFI